MVPANDHLDVTGRRFTGVPVQASFACPRGEAQRTGWGVRIHPSDWMRLRNNGRTPLFTRHTLGTAEAERDRRRYGRR